MMNVHASNENVEARCVKWRLYGGGAWCVQLAVVKLKSLASDSA